MHRSSKLHFPHDTGARHDENLFVRERREDAEGIVEGARGVSFWPPYGENLLLLRLSLYGVKKLPMSSARATSPHSLEDKFNGQIPKRYVGTCER